MFQNRAQYFDTYLYADHSDSFHKKLQNTSNQNTAQFLELFIMDFNDMDKDGSAGIIDEKMLVPRDKCGYKYNHSLHRESKIS